MLIVLLVLAIFSVLILIHEGGHLLMAKRLGVRVEAFSLGFGRRLWGINLGGTDYRISLLPFGGYVKMAGEEAQEATGGEDEFCSKPVGHRFWIAVSGSITNYIFAFFLFTIIFMIGVPTLSNEVGAVLKGYPAESSGIKIGDKIISINGDKTAYWEDIVEAIKRNYSSSSTLDIIIEREKVELSIKVKPNISTVTNVFGQTTSHPIVGIAPASKILSLSYDPLRALYFGGKKLISLTAMTYKGIWLLITGALPLKTSVTGPIGIAYLLGQAANLGLAHLLIITANISMALAIFNLLPFPVLDGGHIIFLTLEKIRKKPLSLKVQEIITQAALAAIIAFALFVSWQDLLKFTPLGGK